MPNMFTRNTAFAICEVPCSFHYLSWSMQVDYVLKAVSQKFIYLINPPWPETRYKSIPAPKTLTMW